MVDLRSGRDEELARERGRESLEALYRRHQSAVERLCRGMADRASDVSDLTQETFLRMCRKIGSYDPQHPFRAWLLTVAANAVIDHLRRRGRWWDLERALQTGATPYEEGDPVLREENAERIRAAVRRLSEPYRMILHLTLWQDLPGREAAAILGIPHGRLRVHLHRALKRLEAELR